MKKNYYNPTAEFSAMPLNDVITTSPVDDCMDDRFAGVSNDVPQLVE